MATAYEDAIEDMPQGLSVPAILMADDLLSLIPDDVAMRIGTKCREGFEADLMSRNIGDDGDSWEDRYKRYLDAAMQVRKAKTFPWPKASNVKVPLLSTSSLQFQARAYPVIIDGSNLVKGRVLGPDPDGTKRERADRIGEHMTWQLMYDMPGWEEDTDRLLLQLPIVGSVFRKTYFDPIQKRNVSKIVTALDFVINYWASSIEDAPRYTHIMRLYPHEVIERMRSGLWKTITLPAVQDHDDQSETAPVEFLEQFCRYDLDDDGYPEPYVVTLCRESGEVVRIVPCFDEDTVTMNMESHEVIRIEPKQYFTQYGFLPSPDGAFYYVGFGALLDDITAAIDATINQLLDAGALQNAQGGFVGSGVNIRSGDLKFRLGEWKRVDVTGGSLRENIVPLNLPGPSAVLFNLLQELIGFAKEITSIQDILTGGAQGVNTPATTTLAQIEQATKLMTGIFKRIHRAFWKELKILFGLNRDHLDEEAYYEIFDAAPPVMGGNQAPEMGQQAYEAQMAAEMQQTGRIGRADYQTKGLDVMPVSDPTQVNDALKAVRAQALLAFNGDPLVNQEAIRRRFFEGTGQPNVKELLQVPPPQPNPEIVAKAADQANTRDKTLSEIRKNNASAADTIMQAVQIAYNLNMIETAEALTAAALRLATDAADMEDNGEPIDGPRNAGGLEGAAPDAGVPVVPEGPAGGLDGGVVPGSAGGPVGGGVPGGNPAPVQ